MDGRCDPLPPSPDYKSLKVKLSDFLSNAKNGIATTISKGIEGIKSVGKGKGLRSGIGGAGFTNSVDWKVNSLIYTLILIVVVVMLLALLLYIFNRVPEIFRFGGGGHGYENIDDSCPYDKSIVNENGTGAGASNCVKDIQNDISILYDQPPNNKQPTNTFLQTDSKSCNTLANSAYTTQNIINNNDNKFGKILIVILLFPLKILSWILILLYKLVNLFVTVEPQTAYTIQYNNVFDKMHASAKKFFFNLFYPNDVNMVILQSQSSSAEKPSPTTQPSSTGQPSKTTQPSATTSPNQTPSVTNASGTICDNKSSNVNEKGEVFNINNSLTYKEARDLCKSIGTKIATVPQLEEAHLQGKEWCHYGWSEGQMGLYPVQKTTEQCKGGPGLVGGLFQDPEKKLGVNCFGILPSKQITRGECTKDKNSLTTLIDNVNMLKNNRHKLLNNKTNLKINNGKK